MLQEDIDSYLFSGESIVDKQAIVEIKTISHCTLLLHVETQIDI